jgi:hypothetical protein
MAPRVDRTAARVSPARWSSSSRSARAGSETDRDLVKNTEAHSSISVLTSCHSSTVKVQPPATIERPSSEVAVRGGRLAQLVRALP